MYKHLSTIILVLSITGLLSAQESAPKRMTVGTDILPLAGGFANALFGFTHNNGKNEVSIGGFVGQDKDEDLSFLGNCRLAILRFHAVRHAIVCHIIRGTVDCDSQ